MWSSRARRKPPDAGHLFVVRVVDLLVPPPQVFAAYAALEEPGEMEARVVVEALADEQGILPEAGGFLHLARRDGRRRRRERPDAAP